MSIPAEAETGDHDVSKGVISEYMNAVLRAVGLENAKELKQHAVSSEHEDVPNGALVDGFIVKHDPTIPVPIVTRFQNKCPERLRPLLPPANFGAVVPGSIYRSSFPSAENFGFLESLKLKTIL